jgi:hypothetical protein
MVEDNVFKDDILVEIVSLVTTALEAAQIINLSVWPGNYLAGYEIDERHLAIFPLSHHMIPKPRLIMA